MFNSPPLWEQHLIPVWYIRITGILREIFHYTAILSPYLSLRIFLTLHALAWAAPRVSPVAFAISALSNRTTSADIPLRWFLILPTPLFFRITDVIPMETHSVPHSNRYPYNSLAWWVFREFSIFLKWPSMYSLKWLHLYRLPVRQTYQRKCFRFLLWECGSFLSQGITKCAYARALYIMYAPTLGAYTPYVPECGVYQ